MQKRKRYLIIGFVFSFGTTEGGNLPLYAVSNFSTAAVNCNLWQYSILFTVIRAIDIWTMSMVFLLISMFGRNALVPFAADFTAALCLVITGALIYFIVRDEPCSKSARPRYGLPDRFGLLGRIPTTLESLSLPTTPHRAVLTKF